MKEEKQFQRKGNNEFDCTYDFAVETASFDPALSPNGYVLLAFHLS